MALMDAAITWLLIQLYNAIHFVDGISYQLFGPTNLAMITAGPAYVVTIWLINTLFLWLLLNILGFITKHTYRPQALAKVAATAALFPVVILLAQFAIVHVLNALFTYSCLGCVGFFNPIVLLGVTILGSILGLFLSLPYLLKPKLSRPLQVVTSIVLSIISLAATVGLFIALVFFEPCFNEYYSRRVFNQHLKELCYLRADTSECPKDASELRAFNPQLYDKLGQCAELEYSFNQATGEVIWTADPYLKGYSAQLKMGSFPDFEHGEEERYKQIQEARVSR